MEGENIGQGSSGSESMNLSSHVDPTSVMPPYPEGPAVDSMSIEDAQKEWQSMTVDQEGKYSKWPRDIFVERRDKLWERGFSQRLADEGKKREEEGKQWLDEENEKIADREDLERVRLAEEVNINFLKSRDETLTNEKAKELLDRKTEEAAETVKNLNDANKDFLDSETPNKKLLWGDTPFIISLLSGIGTEPDLIQAVNSIGLEKLIKLAGKSGIFRRRK